MFVRQLRAAVSPLFILLAVGGAGTGPEATEPSLGKRLVDARCVTCHGRPLTLGFSARLLADAGGDGLDLFLAEHHAPDAEARQAIVDYLKEEAATR